MNDVMVPLSEVAELIVHIVDGHKQAKLLEAGDSPEQTVKSEKNEDKDEQKKDVELDNTDSEDAAKEWSEGVAPIVDPYTTEGSDTKAKDQSSAVETERGSQKPSAQDKLAEFICKKLDEQWG